MSRRKYKVVNARTGHTVARDLPSLKAAKEEARSWAKSAPSGALYDIQAIGGKRFVQAFCMKVGSRVACSYARSEKIRPLKVGTKWK